MRLSEGQEAGHTQPTGSWEDAFSDLMGRATSSWQWVEPGVIQVNRIEHSQEATELEVLHRLACEKSRMTVLWGAAEGQPWDPRVLEHERTFRKFTTLPQASKPTLLLALISTS